MIENSGDVISGCIFHAFNKIYKLKKCPLIDKKEEGYDR